MLQMVREHRAVVGRFSTIQALARSAFVKVAIAYHFSLRVWSAEQVVQYLRQGLAAVGISRAAIEPAALHLLTRASGGLARSLCLLARAA